MVKVKVTVSHADFVDSRHFGHHVGERSALLPLHLPQLALLIGNTNLAVPKDLGVDDYLVIFGTEARVEPRIPLELFEHHENAHLQAALVAAESDGSLVGGGEEQRLNKGATLIGKTLHLAHTCREVRELILPEASDM